MGPPGLFQPFGTQFGFSGSESGNAMFPDVSYFALPIVAIVVLALITKSVRILREYERAVVFTLGRFQRVKGPGLVLLVPFFQEMVRVDLAHPGY